MTVAVVDSGGANIASVLHALRRLGAEPEFTRDASTIEQADRVILPGVGAAGHAMQVLNDRGLSTLVRQLRQPVLGICLGMQLLFESSEEDDAKLLGLIPARLKRLPDDRGLRVPHMGWNTVDIVQPSPLLDEEKEQWFYFVHSYAAPLGEWTVASSHHGESFSAVVKHQNYYGAQFHPERSAQDGASLLRAFLEENLK